MDGSLINWELHGFRSHMTLHDNGCLLYTPILLIEPKNFIVILIFADHYFHGKVSDLISIAYFFSSFITLMNISAIYVF